VIPATTVPRRAALRRAALAALVPALVLLSGCASFGPDTLGRDRLDYDHSVAESWKRQLLLNVVKLRYGDTPLFLDVASITNSYALETSVDARLGWADVVGAGATNSQGIGAASKYSDKPTITYSPLTGSRFTKSLMTPVSPAVVLSLIQAGWSADAVMRLMVTSVNGVQNRFAAGGRARGADEQFYRVIAAMRRLQQSGAIGMKLQKLEAADPEVAVLVLTRTPETDEATQADRSEIAKALGLEDAQGEARVVYGSGRGGDGEILMVTRSLLEMLFDLSASGVDVPEPHLADGRAPPTRSFPTDPEGGYKPLIRVHTSSDEPKDAFVAIPYRGQWFYIDDRDYQSKAMFSFLLIITSLTDSDPGKSSPVITIPAG
jgi:hypothetical protein